MTQAITADASRNDLLMIAGGGLLSGILTPLLPLVVDRISGAPGDLRIALVALPFAVLVTLVVRRCSANRRPILIECSAYALSDSKRLAWFDLSPP